MSYETLFWIAAVFLCAVAVASVLWALLRENAACDASSVEELSREALTEQLRVLDDERAAGLVNDRIYEASVADVQRRALQEIAVEENRPVRAAPWGKSFAVAIALGVAAASVAIYMRLGSPSLINFVSDPPKPGIMHADGSLGSTEGLYDERSLAAYLKDNDKDERAWVLYARLKAKDGQWKQAAEAYKKAVDLNELVAKDADVLVEYAAALISQETEQTYVQSLGVLDRALAINERHLPSHELYAISCLELERWKQAREHIEFLLAQMSMDDPVYQRLAQTAAYAAQRERQQVRESDAR